MNTTQVICILCGAHLTPSYPGMVPIHTLYRRRWWNAWRPRRYTCRGSYAPIKEAITHRY